MQRYPEIKSGSVISAVDLIRGIGHYAGLDIIKVPGATGLANTNYEGKASAAIEALKKQDFVFLHIEASDEAGHDGDLDLKLQTIRYLDARIVKPVYEAVSEWEEPVCIALLPDHPTPVEIRTHLAQRYPTRQGNNLRRKELHSWRIWTALTTTVYGNFHENQINNEILQH